MVSGVFQFVLAFLAALLPIALWGYAFSYLDADRFNARRFALGIATGAAAVFPVAFMPDVSSALPFFGNVFADIAGRVSTMDAAVTFSVFLLAVGLIVTTASFVIRSSELFSDRRAIGRSLAAVALAVPLFALAFFVLSPSVSSSPEVNIAGAALAGFSSLVLAYLVIASVEEAGKHLGLYGTGSFVEIAEKGVLYAAFVALGFAFAENVLYLITALRSDGPFFSTWFSRSIFSVGVHTLCAIAAAVPFVRSAAAGDA